MSNITPTPGRVVWYFPGSLDAIARVANAPLAAIVAAVHDDGRINLAVMDANGQHQARPNVVLGNPGDEFDASEGHAEWMPYQLGQAAKTEAVAAVEAPAAKPAAKKTTKAKE